MEQNIRKIIYIANAKKGADYRRYQGALKAYKSALGETAELEEVMLGTTCEERIATYQELEKYVGHHAALFFSTDFNAAEAMGYFNRKNIRIPEDISIVGCDDDVFARLSVPKLTTVKVDSVRKAEIAAEVMLSLLEGKTIEEKEIKVNTCLIERDSVFINGKDKMNAEN